MTEYSSTAVAFGDVKNAALYFDHLIPVFLATEIYTNRSEWDSLSRTAHGLLPPSLTERPNFAERLVSVNEATGRVFLKLAIQRFGLTPKIGGVSEDEYGAIEDKAVSEYFSFIDDYGLKEYPLASASGPASAWMEDDRTTSPSPVLTLAGLRLIDATRVPWNHLIEFRKDLEAQKRLRRLRLFAYENYDGRPRAYIEDDILSRVSEYEETLRQWGFEAVQGAFTVVANSKLTASLVAGTFLSALFGQPTTALLSGAAGVVIELGHIAFEISRQRFALKKLIRDSPVSFVSYARTSLQGASAR